MRKDLKKENLIKVFVVGLCAVLTGCGTIGLAQDAAFESAYQNMPEEEKPDIYTSESRGVIGDVNTDDRTVTIYRMKEKDELTVVYDSATVVQDKYGSALTMSQLTKGEIVSVRYNSELLKAGSVAVAPDTWSYDNVSKYVIDEGRGTLQVGNDTYRISPETRVFSGSEQIPVNQILKQDEITLKGTGYDVASIIVEKGHGYLNLENEEAMVGGWIEVGQAVIQQISQDMLLTVPEGSYVVRLSVGSMNEQREILIERDKETILDLSDIEVPQPEKGKVVFSIYPSDADVFIDGTGVDVSYALLIPFGLHQITAVSEGYDTLSEYFNVEGETTTVKLTLEKSKEDNTVSGNSAKESGYHTVTIEAPAGAEVYQDNLYMGIAPVTFEKKTGSHTITLRKTGYVTKSYQIEVEDDDRDLIYSFPDLVSEEESRASVSGNTVSGNHDGRSDYDNNKQKTVSGNDPTVSENRSTVSENN